MDSRLTFGNNINKLFKKTNQMLSTLARVFHYIAFDKRKIIMKALITSQCSYCFLVRMVHSKKINKKKNALYERYLRITWAEKFSLFNKLLEKDNSVSIHHKILQALATERNKIFINMFLTIFNQFWIKRCTLTTT